MLGQTVLYNMLSFYLNEFIHAFYQSLQNALKLTLKNVLVYSLTVKTVHKSDIQKKLQH